VAAAVVLVQLEEQEMAQLELEVMQEQEQFHQLQEHLFNMQVAVEVEAILRRLLLVMALLVVETVAATMLAQIHLPAQTVQLIQVEVGAADVSVMLVVQVVQA